MTRLRINPAMPSEQIDIAPQALDTVDVLRKKIIAVWPAFVLRGVWMVVDEFEDIRWYQLLFGNAALRCIRILTEQINEAQVAAIQERYIEIFAAPHGLHLPQSLGSDSRTN